MRTIKNTNRKQKAGFLQDILKEASKLSVPVALVVGRNLLKSKKNQKGGFANDLVKEAAKLAVPVVLVSGRELYKKMSKKNHKGGNCAIKPVTNVPNCIPDVNMSQYKCPCGSLPLDGPKHNYYPLSNNPPARMNGGKRKSKKNKKL